MHSLMKVLYLYGFLGRPSTPLFGDLESGLNSGEITIMVKCLGSGIDNHSEVFGFIITPILNGIEGESLQHLSLNYQSGAFETITVGGLQEGKSYVINATAVNSFGRSPTATSSSILAGTQI